MPDLSGFPSAEIQYDATGAVIGTDQGVLDLAADGSVTDLLVLTHGWNDDASAARRLFADLAASLRTVLDQGGVPALTQRRIGVVGVIWPSLRFGANLLLRPGGADATGSAVSPRSVVEEIERLRPAFPDPTAQRSLDNAAALVPDLADRATARDSFVEHLRTLVADGPADDPADTPPQFDTQAGRVIMDSLSAVSLAPPRGRRPGSAEYLRVAGGPFGAALNVLNYLTFYEMKKRSGVIGETGLGPTITKIRAARSDRRLHLAGHSLGARLISAAARALAPGPPEPIATVTLLQAAFSHYGFSDDWDPAQPGEQAGYFRADVTGHRVSGPMLITYTANDLVVGVAYAIASRLARQVAEFAPAVGDASDIYGGLGRNGALRTPEAVAGALLAVGGPYQWQPGRPHNLLADAYIANHGDVTNPEVGYAMLSAIAST